MFAALLRGLGWVVIYLINGVGGRVDDDYVKKRSTLRSRLAISAGFHERMKMEMLLLIRS